LLKIWNKIIHYPRIGLVILAYVAFIALGMPDGLLGVAWPSIRTDFSIPLDAIGLLLPVTVAGYMTSSFFSGPIVSRFGVGRVLAASCVLTAAGLIGYTLVPAWWMMVSLGILAGLGAGAIDAGLNTYAAAHFGENLMQWLHASYGIGVTLGPIIMTVALSRWASWHLGYRVVGGFQIALAICFVFTLAMWNRKENSSGVNESKSLTDYKTPMKATLRLPRAWLSAILFMLYCGTEIALGTWIYSLLVESRGIDATIAGLFAGSYWAMFTAGRVTAGIYAKRIGNHALIAGGLAGASTGTLLLILNPSKAANLIAVALIGFSIAPIFPALMSGTSRRVGESDAANTIGMQMAATGLGGAVIPSVLGVLARRFSLEIVPTVLLMILLILFGLYQLSMASRMEVQESVI